MLTIEKRKWLTFGLCLAMLILVLLVLSLFVPVYGEICDQASHCISRPLVMVAAWDLVRFLDASSTFVTGIATAFLAWTTYLLFHLGREQSNTSRAQLRAYVAVSGSSFERLPDTTIGFKLSLKNYGVTPANRVRTSLAIKFAPENQGPPFLSPQEQSLESSIPPSEESPETHFSNEVSDEVWMAFFEGRICMFAWGKITYLDVFMREQTTQFRMVNHGGRLYAKTGFLRCEGGNEAT